MGSFLAGHVEMVLGYWRAIGIEATLQLTEHTAFHALFRNIRTLLRLTPLDSGAPAL